MKWVPNMLAVLMLHTASASAAEQIVTLGDSLTFAYEAEFGFQLDLYFVSYGDGFGSRVRNWAEILNDPLYRHDRFDLGTRQNISVLGFYDIFFRHKNNWAIPGLKVKGLRRFVNGEETFLNLLDLGPDLTYIIEQSSFNDVADFPLADLKSQIQNTAERLTFFIGGNDVKEIYGNVYNGGSAGTFIEVSVRSFVLTELEAWIKRQQAVKPCSLVPTHPRFSNAARADGTAPVSHGGPR